MKVIVTGSKGFIAKNLIESLSDHDVSKIDLEDFYQNEFWRYDLLKIIEQFNPDVIFHVGACSDTMELGVNYMMELNYDSTKVIANYCKSTGCKLIYSSSAANSGDNGLGPSNLYGWSKYVAEDLVLLLDGVALRYFNVYGPGEEHKGRMASVAYQAWSTRKYPGYFKLFRGKPTRDFVYVKDVVSANLHALKNYETLKGKYFEVGSGESRSFEEVLDLMELKYDYRPESATPRGYQFFTASNKDLWMPEWSPRYTIDTGIPEYLMYLNNAKQNDQN